MTLQGGKYLVFLLLVAGPAASQDVVGVTEISPAVLVFATSSGNAVASVGPDGALLIGTPSAASTAEIEKILSSRTKSPLRYVVIGPQDLAHSQGDAGWLRRGAFVAMHENALGRLGGHAMGPAQPLPPHLVELGVARPPLAFSEVLSFDMNGEAIHIVHQPAAYSDADSVVHFHTANLIYLGDVFPGDGYPEVDFDQGGKLDGVLKLLGSWTGNKFWLVPARGKVMKGGDVKALHDMVVVVRDRVQRLLDAGKSEAQAVAEHPTADFDGRWGNGRITPDVFVREVFQSLKKP